MGALHRHCPCPLHVDHMDTKFFPRKGDNHTQVAMGQRLGTHPQTAERFNEDANPDYMIHGLLKPAYQTTAI